METYKKSLQFVLSCHQLEGVGHVQTVCNQAAGFALLLSVYARTFICVSVHAYVNPRPTRPLSFIYSFCRCLCLPPRQLRITKQDLILASI